ncbi:MAG: putative Protein PTHB1 [Streblomastix strix]|uniref:Uncharacterized protein n=1 Tax=Streblomastix strix TaxID=222440 RepID=A0A5J4V5V8_9EUKA|nr:MAG: putative Protein PTHB1 [Streblomastix strix]
MVIVPQNTQFTSIDGFATIFYDDPLNGGSQSVSCSFTLPLLSILRPIPPIKQAQFKMTIETNKEPLQISKLYDDVLQNISSDILSAPGVISFQYHSGVDATILVSKSVGKYRIQSSSLDALRIVGEDLVNRLQRLLSNKSNKNKENKIKGNKKKRRQNKEDEQDEGDDEEEDNVEPEEEEEEEEEEEDGEDQLQISTSDPIPFNTIYAIIDEHYNIRCQLRNSILQMDKKANLIKAIEKRLLVRCKEKSVSPLSNMDVFFDLNLKEQMIIIQKTSYLFEKLSRFSLHLENAVHVMILVASLKLNLTQSLTSAIRSLFQTPLSLLSPLSLSPDYSSSNAASATSAQGQSSSILSPSTIVGGWEETIENSLLRSMKDMMKRNMEEMKKEGSNASNALPHVDIGTISSNLEFPIGTTRIRRAIQAFFEMIAKGGQLLPNQGNESED